MVSKGWLFFCSLPLLSSISSKICYCWLLQKPSFTLPGLGQYCTHKPHSSGLTLGGLDSLLVSESDGDHFLVVFEQFRDHHFGNAIVHHIPHRHILCFQDLSDYWCVALVTWDFGLNFIELQNMFDMREGKILKKKLLKFSAVTQGKNSMNAISNTGNPMGRSRSELDFFHS